MIEIIIGEIGLLFNAKRLEPKILDTIIDTTALDTQNNIPGNNSLLILNKIFFIFYYT